MSVRPHDVIKLEFRVSTTSSNENLSDPTARAPILCTSRHATVLEAAAIFLRLLIICPRGFFLHSSAADYSPIV